MISCSNKVYDEDNDDDNDDDDNDDDDEEKLITVVTDLVCKVKLHTNVCKNGLFSYICL